MNATLKNIGEFGLINRIAKQVKKRQNVLMGIGDDTAVIRRAKKGLLLVTSDMLIEGIHFTREKANAYQIGWKALGCGLSDISAMGGIPMYALVSLGLPVSIKVKFVDNVYMGIRDLANVFGVSIVGGDTNKSRNLVIDVVVLGEVEHRHLVLRSGADVGDVIFVTGRLGGSVYSRHLYFMPRVKEARILVKNYRINSMIDISDGLSSDLDKISNASGVGAIVYEELIPVHPDARSREEALYMGEDYELLFTMPISEARRIFQKFPNGINVPVRRIGEIIDRKFGINIVTKDGNLRTLKPKGFRHF